MFRDQSQIVMTRVQENSRAQIQDPEHDPSALASEPTIIHSPKMSEDSGLVDFFTNNFTSHNANSFGDNLFGVPDNFNDLLKNGLVNLSIQSVGAMALARLRRSPYYLRRAQERYGSALIALAEVWRLDDDIERDAILLVVLFLSFFEILASFDTFNQSWLAHMQGLRGLLQRRAHLGTTSTFGVRVAAQTQSQAIHNALQTSTAVPEEVVRISQRDRSSVPLSQRQFDDVNVLLIRLANFQAQHRSSGMSRDMSIELTALDGDLSAWARNVPPPWTYSMQPNKYESGVWWDMRHDVYSSRVMSYIWNKTRAARLIIHDLMQEYLLSVSADELSSPAYSVTRVLQVRQLVIDICATIPPYYRPLDHAPRKEEEDRPLLGSTYWLLWVLEVVGSIKEVPADLKSWVLQCLDRIYEITGIVKAQSVATRLRTGRGRLIIA